jgi:hypothetical protein
MIFLKKKCPKFQISNFKIKKKLNLNLNLKLKFNKNFFFFFFLKLNFQIVRVFCATKIFFIFDTVFQKIISQSQY